MVISRSLNCRQLSDTRRFLFAFTFRRSVLCKQRMRMRFCDFLATSLSARATSSSNFSLNRPFDWFLFKIFSAPHSNRDMQRHATDPTPFWRRRRYFVVMMAFFGLFNVYALRVNLSVAIVAMTENRTVEHSDGTVTYEQYFDWNSKEKGYILSSFFYGYLMTQVQT